MTGKPISGNAVCPVCSAEVEEDWKVCANCGTLLKPQTTSIRRQGIWLGSGLLLVCLIFVAGMGLFNLLGGDLPQTAGPTANGTQPPTDTGEAPLEEELATLPPPLEFVEFPQGAATYPDEWPDPLRFPAPFELVDTVSGALPDSGVEGWSAKFRYPGTPEMAADLLESFFAEVDWEVVERAQLDAGGELLLVETGEGGSGIIVIDPDPNDPAITRVLATLVP